MKIKYILAFACYAVIALLISTGLYFVLPTDCYTVDTHQENEAFICEWNSAPNDKENNL